MQVKSTNAYPPSSWQYRFIKGAYSAIKRITTGKSPRFKSERAQRNILPRGDSLSSLSSSKSGGSTFSRASSLDSLENPETFRSHLMWHAHEAYEKAFWKPAPGSALSPQQRGHNAVQQAVAKETARVQGLFVARHKAELKVIRARTLERLACGVRHKASRDHKSGSAADLAAMRNTLEVSEFSQQAHHELYLAQTAR